MKPDAEPDFIFAACGDIVANEAIEAIRILSHDIPEIKIRFVYIDALSYRGIGTTNNKLNKTEFEKLFTKDKPIIANFHGYPETLENILENYTERRRLRVHGFNEEGSTTTPFEMLRKNAASRYDLALDVAKVLKLDYLVSEYETSLSENHAHAVKYGTDMI
jgi:xylulose-5-phosphate/fructose-6-phosphate phosphoketolase